MPAELREHAGRHYAVQYHYSLPNDAWTMELSEAVPAPTAWADDPEADRHLPGAAVVAAFVPDEDPGREPTIHVGGHDERVIPYEIVRWFMGFVDQEVERRRTAFEHNGPDAEE